MNEHCYKQLVYSMSGPRQQNISKCRNPLLLLLFGQLVLEISGLVQRSYWEN